MSTLNTVAKSSACIAICVRPGLVIYTPLAVNLTIGIRDAQPARRRDQPLSAATCRQPGRLAPVERSGARARALERQAHPAVDRLLGVSLVSRDGARVVRGRRDSRADERALRVHQG